ncbi:hypothetical protein LTS08_000178 [Lithohypha guttulata]|nr:hypothetical protein LTS08_000178 [Lithohypha guttulata]
MPARTDSGCKNSIENLERKKEQIKKRKPFQGYKTAVGPGEAARAKASPLKNVVQPQAYEPVNPPSTVLWQQTPRTNTRSHSPLPPEELGSPPPPAPPPHRSGVMNGHISRAVSPAPSPYEMNQSYPTMSRTPSPNIASFQGHTPPMIRDAMEDVMSSLEGMSVQHEAMERQISNPWSPEAFDDFRQAQPRPGLRPLTSLGLAAGGSTYSEEAREKYSKTYVQRMERQLEERARHREASLDPDDRPPPPPPKQNPWNAATVGRRLSLRRPKSTYDLTSGLDRTYTTKTNSTNSSSGVGSLASYPSNASSKTSQSIFSGYSAGGFSATSAGSLARKRNGFNDYEPAAITARPTTSNGIRSERPKTPNTGYSYHQSHDPRAGARSAVGFEDRPVSSAGSIAFSTPKAKKTGLFKKLNETVKTSFASARSTIAPNGGDSTASSPTKHSYNNGVTSIAGGMHSPTKGDRHKNATSSGYYGSDAAREMGMDMGAGADWLRTRRDVNRSNTPGPSERQERAERCQMLNEPVICPVDELYETVQGDEDVDGGPVYHPFALSNPSFTQVDKAARFVTSLPSSITAASLATGYVCRPYRTDAQRVRAIFIWCAERLTWSADIEGPFGAREQMVDTRRVILQKSGSSREVAAVVMEMCRAVGLPSETIHGYLKRPGESLDIDAATPSKCNHYWNSVLIDGEWRLLDSSLASPTNPQRSLYSNISQTIAEPFYFLAKPSELCWTHVPLEPSQQYLVPAISPDTLLALPAACPPFFRLGIMVHAYDTSLTHMEGLEMSTITVNTPVDTEVFAEVEAQAYARDNEGDLYEDPDTITRVRALSQPTWYRTSSNPDVFQKRYIIKALLPGDEQSGTLKIYAGKKGLMHSAKEIVHPLAFALPLHHQGENPAYEFVRRHPTPHATRQDIYVIQPQCYRLDRGEKYVFYVRQHPATVNGTPTSERDGFDFPRPTSPNPLIRPSSAMSMTSSAAGSGSTQGSDYSNPSLLPNGVKIKEKYAKLSLQAPSGRIIRFTRSEGCPQNKAAQEVDGVVVGSVWECHLKVTERGVWRGLVLADRSARWCVWGEWECS